MREKIIEIMDKHTKVNKGMFVLVGGLKSLVDDLQEYCESIPVEKRVSPTEPTQGNCEKCQRKVFCDMYKVWKESEADYFDKDVSDFSCRHFIPEP